MKSNKILYTLFFVILRGSCLSGDSLDRYMLGENVFSYEGYTIERKTTEEKGVFYGSIKLLKGSALIREFPKARAGTKENIKNVSAFGLANILKKEGKKELVIKSCPTPGVKKYFYWVYTLEPELRLIFATEKWQTGFVLGMDDIDNDNVKELLQTNLAFDSFERCTHVTSAIFDIYFKYDPARGEYFPANHLYKQMVGNDFWTKEPLNNKDRAGVHLGSILKTLLPLAYSGQEKEAWNYYDNDYALVDKATMKEKIKLRMQADPAYKYIQTAVTSERK